MPPPTHSLGSGRNSSAACEAEAETAVQPARHCRQGARSMPTSRRLPIYAMRAVMAPSLARAEGGAASTPRGARHDTKGRIA